MLEYLDQFFEGELSVQHYSGFFCHTYIHSEFLIELFFRMHDYLECSTIKFRSLCFVLNIFRLATFEPQCQQFQE